MSKLKKQDIIFRIMEKGYSQSEAEMLWDTVLDLIKGAMMAGEVLTLWGIGALIPEIREAETLKQFGSVDAPKRLKVKFKQSRTLYNEYLEKHSAEAKKKDAMAKIRGIL